MNDGLPKGMIIDEIEARNVLRRGAGLPLLDVRREVVSVLRDHVREHRRRVRELRGHDHPEIAQGVINDLRSRGVEDKTLYGQWAVRAEILRRLDVAE